MTLNTAQLLENLKAEITELRTNKLFQEKVAQLEAVVAYFEESDSRRPWPVLSVEEFTKRYRQIDFSSLKDGWTNYQVILTGQITDKDEQCFYLSGLPCFVSDQQTYKIGEWYSILCLPWFENLKFGAKILKAQRLDF